VSRAAVFLDRDGVINRALLRDGRPIAPLCESELEILPDAVPALTALRERDLALIVVTNQPEVARGALSPETVERLHARLRRELPLEAILACFHDGAACECRKPRPGLLLQAARELQIDLRASFMVGDRASDVLAGERAGCTTIFIDRDYAEAGPARCDFRVRSLWEAAQVILARTAPS